MRNSTAQGIAIAAWALLGTSAQAKVGTSDGPLTVSLNPQRVCATAGAGFYPNVDLLIVNPRATEVQIDEIHALLRDSKGQLIERRMLWQQGLNILGRDKILPARSTTIIFNPFAFAHDVAGRSLTFEVKMVGREALATVTTTPQRCANSYSLRLPVTGRVLVYDGFDYLSHHRRGTYDDDWSKAMEISDNFQRFGLDLVVIDPSGRYFRGDGSRTDQWLGWGTPIRAAAAGTVEAVHDGQPDNVVIGTVDKWTDRPSKANPMSSYGNYVLIRHGPGEYTLVGHLRNGSVRVAKGQAVIAGEVIGAMGNSGASGGVHTHFERRTGWGLAGIETLPAYLGNVSLGGSGKPRSAIAPSTGDVLIAR